MTVTLTNHTQQRFEILNGAKGGTGDAASIKEITASIDNGIGTPSVTVTATGTGAEKNVHFDFKNLKGETGDIALTEEVKRHISRSVASANQYTDDAIGAIEQRIEEANQRIDTGDTNTLQAAKKYADQNVQAEAQTRAQCDAATLSSAKKYTDELLIKIFQNGYIQWPWMPKPETVFTFEGYRWAEVDYNGCFFRAKGKGANPFNGEEQGDAIRNITGTVAFDAGNRIISSSGVFKTVERGGDRSWTADGYWEKQNMSFDASRVVPTADENRSRNKTFIIWQLKKI